MSDLRDLGLRDLGLRDMGLRDMGVRASAPKGTIADVYGSLAMLQRFFAHICFLSLVLSAAVSAPAQQPKTDSDAAVSQTLQAMERAWLDAEK